MASQEPVTNPISLPDEAIATLLSIFDGHHCSSLVDALKNHNGNLERTIDYLILSAQPSSHLSPSPLPSRRLRDPQPDRPQKKVKLNALESWLHPVKSDRDRLLPDRALDHPLEVATASRRPHGSNVGQNTGDESRAEGSATVRSQPCPPPPSLRSLNEVLGRSCAHPSQPSMPQSLPRPSLSPLLLSSPEQVSLHLPCSLLYNVLPKDLAARLYLKMIDDCEGRGASRTAWRRNRWWLNGKEVESPHSTAFFIANPTNEESLTADYRESAQYWYAGKALEADAEPRFFIDEMEQAKQIIEPLVNNLLASDPDTLRRADRKPDSMGITRYAEEWDGHWRANVAATNCYRGSKEGVGWHADQLTYLGPYPTIASLSLGTRRQFRLRPVPNLHASEPERVRTYTISLPHNSLLVMHAGCQERYKHCVPPQPALDVFHCPGPAEGRLERINLTFRFYRPDFRPSAAPRDTSASSVAGAVSTGTPRCLCGVPAILRADQKGRATSSHHFPRPDPSGQHPSPFPPLAFFWQCQAGQQDPSKGCRFFRFLDLKAECRGPCLGDGDSDPKRHEKKSSMLK